MHARETLEGVGAVGAEPARLRPFRTFSEGETFLERRAVPGVAERTPSVPDGRHTPTRKIVRNEELDLCGNRREAVPRPRHLRSPA